MKKLVIVLCTFLISSCGLSKNEKNSIAFATCDFLEKTRNVDSVGRIREMNNAREKLGGEPYLRGDDTIKEALEWDLCWNLVLNESYDEVLKFVVEEKRVADSKPTVIEEFHENGRFKSRTNYQPKSEGGKKHGLFEEDYDNGQLKYRTNYKDGVIHGLHEYYHSDGHLSSTQFFSDGGQSVYKMYYKNGNGQLWFHNHSQDGKRHGLSLIYNRDGTVESARCFRNGEETEMSFCEE